ncbi:hypothetical protein KUTeg_017808 [Tegillarca granosa]|uniref:Uncharacterized protein n=1 Tax=Tegillarca granosa TaxID=220873 RepID=A0ABQ9EL01_TEGGR|nr:hypothetical protein KUTeg_017808 [Tegillarca granosa]
MKFDNVQDVDGDTVDARQYHGWHQQVNVVIGRQTQHQQQYNKQPAAFNVQPEPVSNPANARRWYKQAGKDLAAAQKFMEVAGEVDGYNWVCYKSHQVSNLKQNKTGVLSGKTFVFIIQGFGGSFKISNKKTVGQGMIKVTMGIY